MANIGTLSVNDYLISNVNVTHFTPQFFSTSVNLKDRAKDRDLHQLKITFDVTLGDDAKKRSFESFLMKAKGRLNTFYLDLGDRFNSNTATDTPLTSSSVAAGVNQVPIDSFTGSIIDGDMVQFLNDSKIYIATNTVTTSGLLSITPSLRVNQTNNSPLTLETKPEVRIDTDEVQIDYGQGIVHTFSMSVIEVL